MGDKPEPDASPTLAAKIDRLFRTVHPPGRGEFSAEEVASALRERGGPTISSTYVWQLRRGIRDNPTKKHLEGLAAFFHVPPAYFFDDEAAERIEAELDLVAAMRDQGVRSIALRAVGLDQSSIELVRSLVEKLQRLPAPRVRGASHVEDADGS